MLLDSQMSLSAAQAVTSTGDTASTNTYDTGTALDGGIGEHTWISVFAKTTVTSGGAATVTPVLQDSANDSSYADLLVGQTFALANLTAGRPLMRVRVPVGSRRYLRVVYRVATAALTGGTFDAYVSKDIQALQYGASGFTVS